MATQLSFGNIMNSLFTHMHISYEMRFDVNTHVITPSSDGILNHHVNLLSNTKMQFFNVAVKEFSVALELLLFFFMNFEQINEFDDGKFIINRINAN